MDEKEETKGLKSIPIESFVDKNYLFLVRNDVYETRLTSLEQLPFLMERVDALCRLLSLK